jgi:outer membrane protein
VNAGSLPEGDLMQLEAQQATDSASLISSENNLKIAYLNLTQLLQLEPDEGRTFEIERPNENLAEETEVTADLETVINKAVNTLPEMKSAQANVMSAETGLSISKGQMSPNLSVSYSIGSGYSGANNIAVGDPVNLGQVPIGVVESSGATVLSIQDQTTYEEFDTKPFNDQVSDNFNQSLFFSLNIPIFNGLSTHSNIQRSQINVRNAQLQLDLTKNQLMQNVQGDYFDMLAAYENYRAAKKSVEAQQRAFDYASVRYEAGVINTVDYTNARILLDNAKADLVRNKFDFVFKAKVIDFYTGKPILLD